MSLAGTLNLSVQYQSQSSAPKRDQCRRWIQGARAVLGDPRPCRLTLRFVNGAEQRKLNATFRQRDYATNVLTFNYDVPGQVMADVVVCVPVAKREAQQQKKDPKAHFAHLVVHGVLHAYGLDHENQADALEMERMEGRILARFDVLNPYD
jgi:probable rRNA maturation factor